MSAHRPPRSRWLAPRWLATGSAVVLAGALGTALLLQNGGGACAAPPTSAKHSGKATFYDLGGGQGNCSSPTPADDLFVALGPDEYSGAASCGSYLDVTGPKGKVRVKVIDKCPECAPGHLDLSRTAYKKIGAEIDGIIPITYKAVPNAATPGPLSITFKDGTSAFWFAVMVDNHANPIKSLQAKGPSGSFVSATQADFNFWIIDAGAGSGPFQIKMTDIYGNTATAKNIKLLPQQAQQTSVRFAGGSVAVAKSTPKASPSSPSPSKKSASPSPSSSSSSKSASPSASTSASASASPAATAAVTSVAGEEETADLALAAGTPATTC
ncbi:expansin EXLX1 family cellulose-binding protein [Actinoplanes sp. NPDC051494]|uniref:expansin EXLX1 family cellulose-binding protein n=1 Tax=Actinoplanes sp. NPDC051494 TaxID=3363907 RepID=UPI00379BFB9A